MTTDYDSILTATNSNVVNRTEYYKIGASMPDDTVAMAVRPQPIGNDTLIAGSMVLMFFILSAIVCKGRAMLLHRIKELFTFSRKSSIDECAADNSGESLSLFLLLLMAATCASVIFFNPIIEESTTIPYVDTPYWLYAAGTGVAFGVFCLKMCLYKIVNWVFFNRASRQRWTTYYMYATAFTVVTLYPTALLSTFHETSRHIVFWTVIFTFILYEVVLFCKLLVNFKIRSYGYLLIFLYFCSVELMPAVVTWQIASYYSRNIIVKILLY